MKARKQPSIGDLQATGVVALTKKQMAAAIQVCPRTITDMMRRGEISFFRIGKRLVRFRVEDALKRMSETYSSRLMGVTNELARERQAR